MSKILGKYVFAIAYIGKTFIVLTIKKPLKATRNKNKNYVMIVILAVTKMIRKRNKTIKTYWLLQENITQITENIDLK